jgi:hypothetical protein
MGPLSDEMIEEAKAISADGPDRQFAAVQRYARCRPNTGWSVDAAGTAAPDPERKSIGPRGSGPPAVMLFLPPGSTGQGWECPN